MSSSGLDFFDEKNWSHDFARRLHAPHPTRATSRRRSEVMPPRANAARRVSASRPKLAFATRKRTTTKKRAPTRKKVSKRTGHSRRAARVPSRNALIDKLAAPIFIDLSIQDTYQVPPDTTADGRGVLWADPSGFSSASAADSNLGGHLDVSHLALIANVLDPAAGNNNYHYVIHSAKVQHQLMNMSTGQANLTAYKCVARRDLPNTTAFGSGPVITLQNGWIENGVAVPANGNYAMTPFQSPSFCSAYKIVKVKTYVFEPGQQITLGFKTGRHPVSMQNYYTVPDQTKTWLTATQDFSVAKGSTFYLWKFSGQLQDFTATSIGPGYTEPKIFCTTTYQYEVKQASAQKEKIYKVNLRTNVGTLPQIINPLTGVLELPVTNPIVNG